MIQNQSKISMSVKESIICTKISYCANDSVYPNYQRAVKELYHVNDS